MLVVKCGNQEALINIEEMSLIKKKVFLWSTPNMGLEMRVEEHIYKLERDESKMLLRLKQSNLNA